MTQLLRNSLSVRPAGQTGSRWLPTMAACIVVAISVTVPVKQLRAAELDARSELARSELARQLASSDEDQRRATIEQLRRQGPSGLAAALDAYRAANRAAIGGRVAPVRAAKGARPAMIVAPQDVPRLAEAVDLVAGQYLGHESGLYWYTDRAEAHLVSRETGRPMLSLRLLGDLTEPMSCANSRFFRTTLYVDPDIAAYLRDHYVLHWESLRPVPMIHIDLGNGREIHRPITGNSAHYILSADGEVLDCLPGLHGPQAFLAWLERTQAFATELAAMEENNRPERVRTYHRDHLTVLNEQLIAALGTVPAITGDGSLLANNKVRGAVAANRLTMSKRVVEQPILQAITRVDLPPDLLRQIDWNTLAAARGDAVQLSPQALEVIAAQTGEPISAEGSPMTDNLKQSILADQLRNELFLHRQVHEWMATSDQPYSIDTLNDRVYAELFLMPPDDPWLGLIAPNAYTGLPGQN